MMHLDQFSGDDGEAAAQAQCEAEAAEAEQAAAEAAEAEAYDDNPPTQP